MDLCPELGISVPVGKDSTSMKMGWTDPATKASKEVTAPLSLVVTAFAPVINTHKTWTPALQRSTEVGETILLFVDLAEGHKAMGGSAIAQVFNQIGNEAPDVRKYVLFETVTPRLSNVMSRNVYSLGKRCFRLHLSVDHRISLSNQT